MNACCFFCRFYGILNCYIGNGVYDMRLRHIKGCEDFITDAKECLREGEAIALKGKIQDISDIRRPLQIEIGMGKGQFMDKIFLNFSDPWPKDRHANRRLTSPDFLQVYDRILKPEGVIEFKTDNVGLFEYSLEVVKDSKWKLDFCSFDFHSEKESEGNIMTEYEEKFSGQGNKICKMIISR